jgi:hypothetical protein
MGMSKKKHDLSCKEAPIERIFRDVVRREMTPNERQVLIPKPKKKQKAAKSHSAHA